MYIISQIEFHSHRDHPYNHRFVSSTQLEYRNNNTIQPSLNNPALRLPISRAIDFYLAKGNFPWWGLTLIVLSSFQLPMDLPLDLFAENYPDLDFGNHAIKSELVKSSCYCKVAKHSWWRMRWFYLVMQCWNHILLVILSFWTHPGFLEETLFWKMIL